MPCSRISLRIAIVGADLFAWKRGVIAIRTQLMLLHDKYDHAKKTT
jgi:hypothetical protein